MVPSFFNSPTAAGVGSVPIHGDHPRFGIAGILQSTLQEIDGLAAGIDRSVQEPLFSLHLNAGLIDPPSPIDWFQMPPAAFVQLRPGVNVRHGDAAS
jgi:hypothetical protein